MKKEQPTAPPIESIYPDLPTVNSMNLKTEPNDSAQSFRLKQIREIREYLQNEAETRGRLRRRYKSAYNTAHYVNMGSSLTAVASSTAAAISLTTVIGTLAALPLGIVAIATGVVGIVSSKISKLVLKKTEKHERIKLIAMSKLSSVNDLVSKALTDGKISDEEFHVILNEMESYRDLKSQVRKRIRNELSSEREQEIREESEKKRIVERPKDGYEQPPEYSEAFRLAVYINCCSNNTE